MLSALWQRGSVWRQTRFTRRSRRPENLLNNRIAPASSRGQAPGLTGPIRSGTLTATSSATLRVRAAFMAKQRRLAPRSTKASPDSAVGAERRAEEAAPPRQLPSQTPQRRSTYFEAVALYEQGLEALQRHAYQEAASLLESVLGQYPEEKELRER